MVISIFGSGFIRLPKIEMMNGVAGYAQILNFLRYLRGTWNRTWDFYFSLLNLLVRNHLINFKWFCCGVGHLSWFFLWGASTTLGWHPLMISLQLLKTGEVFGEACWANQEDYRNGPQRFPSLTPLVHADFRSGGICWIISELQCLVIKWNVTRRAAV